MLIAYHGHSQFLLTDHGGQTLLTDPYDGHVGYPLRQETAQIVTISHHHADHDHVGKVQGHPIVINGGGPCSPAPDVFVDGYPVWHDDAQGARRGPNLMMKITMDGVTLLHAGDLGCMPGKNTMAALTGLVDVLCVPVGGFYTLNGAEAADFARRIGAKVVIPMHYKTQVNPDWPISGPEDFLRAMNAMDALTAPVPLLRVEKGDLSQQPPVVVMDWRR